MSKYIYLSIFSCLVFLGITHDASATHNRAGEITYIQTGPLSIRATITTYTKASSRQADRDSLNICWGDGNCETVLRQNGGGNGVIIGNDTKINIYVADHTYGALATYSISMTDPNRNGQILNVNPPASDQVPFHLQTTVTFFNLQFSGFNNSPVLLQPPIDIGCIDQVFTHNPNAYDPDGDSLSYSLITPLQDVGTQVPNYSFPNQINPGPNNVISIDPITGQFTWRSPQRAGEYNIAIQIVEYRNGIAIDTMLRDMQILIVDCENDPPEIEVIDEICVIAGDLVQLNVTGTAPLTENDQLVSLTARGGPFEVAISPAEFNVASGFQPQPLTGVFRWQTTCEHISDQFYTVVFRAQDNFAIPSFGGDSLFLSSLKSIRIKVVGPPPLDVAAVAQRNQITVSWELPYVCEDAADEYFQGFSVWRRIGSNLFPINDCTPGLDGRGYVKLNRRLTKEQDNGRYQYIDTDVDRGRTYCYRVLAEFGKVSSQGYVFNIVESLPSNESCIQLSRDVPLLTDVSVETTNTTTGEMFVQWTKPDILDLDTVLNPGPYRYELLRTDGFSNMNFLPIPGAVFNSQFIGSEVDTFFVDTGLNTTDQPYTYKVDFYIRGGEYFGSSSEASSVYLNIESTDEKNILTWDAQVPWDNFEFIIFRESSPGVFDSIGITTEPIYEDFPLINGIEYCYRIETRGSYGIVDIRSPLINLSQRNCGIPLDTIPPCPPELEVSNICEDGFDGSCSDEILKNDLNWLNPNDLCEDTDDVIAYNVYYAPTEGSDFSVIGTFESPDSTMMTHFPEGGFAGCYAVTAIDSFNNESAFSNIVCVDNCPIYELPNVFTPNLDGDNDLYIPINQCFIARVQFTVMNKWGNVVFETENPNLQWNGQNKSSQDVNEGVYYYVCRVFEQRVGGVTQSPEILEGYIEVIR